MSWRDELSENVWAEGTLRLEYGKSGIYNSNRLPAKKKKKEKEEKEKIPGIGWYPMGPTIILLSRDFLTHQVLGAANVWGAENLAR